MYNTGFSMMSVDELRVEVIELLKEAYTVGSISAETLEKRLKTANATPEKEILIGLVKDIPAPEKTKGTGYDRKGTDRPWRLNSRGSRKSEVFFAVMGGSIRTGRWQPARNISCMSLMGSISLDFREAEFPPEGVSIQGACIMGSLDIKVPPGINVNLTGFPFLGSMQNQSGEGDRDAPTLTVRGLAIMGSIDIRRKEVRENKTGERGSKAGRNRRPGRKAKDRFYDYD